ncbi:MAG TPA: T9SS type A sorting domain-containing protein [bacterium]
MSTKQITPKKFMIIFIIIIHSNLFSQIEIPNYLIDGSWDRCSQWKFDRHNNSTIECASFVGIHGDGMCIKYHLSPNRSSPSWVRMIKDSLGVWSKNHPIVFLIKADAHDDIELKFVDEDGTVFLKRYPLENSYHEWNQIVVYLNDTKYAWGADSSFEKLGSFEIAFSGDSSGTVWIDEIGVGQPELQSGRYLDPYREAVGYGFIPRRDFQVLAENSQVLEYFEVLQDSSSSDGWLLPNYDHAPLVSTFNNGLAAMAFIIKNQKERAERILDFYASATDSNNQDCTKQAFFCRGEARGFYQQMQITDYSRGSDTEDRWIGDMAWLLMAYKHYENKYERKAEYLHVVRLICDLLKSFFRDVGHCRGYVQTGWQKGDAYFDSTGHVEGNISCYAALKCCGEEKYAQKIKIWLLKKLQGNNLPLDNYTWRVLAFGEPAFCVLSIPEFDFRFRKKIVVANDSLFGFYPYPDSSVNNVWTEGIGHMACAQWHFGDRARAYFYANQFDYLFKTYDLYGKTITTLPYAANRSGEFAGIDTTIGSVSSSAWYVFAKNGFNPLCVDCSTTEVIRYSSVHSSPQRFELFPNFPNPFNPSTTISYSLRQHGSVELKVFNLLGQEIITLVNEKQFPGIHYVVWDGRNKLGQDLSSGIYIYFLKSADYVDHSKMLLIR